MVTIRKLLDQHLPTHYIDDRLAWGAQASAYEDRIRQALTSGETVVLVELEDDLGLLSGLDASQVVNVDHHGELAGQDRPTALEQVFKLLRLPDSAWTREFELVAANDRGHVAAMLERQASQKELEKIRSLDRAAQGITRDEERVGRLAAANAETVLNGWLTLVRLPHSRTATVTDVLQRELGGPGYENLLISCPDSVMFYGQGQAIAALREKFPDGFWGGELPVRGFWGRSVATGRNDLVNALSQVARKEP